LIKTTVQHMFP